ncbi:thiol-disulfide oxidoreductase DCC family protein [Microvirga sp. Mcv34]|uniref:thiol-disulfide oxidoreductase DCC family protein n=1 Tax=Microvirga sp. Mcv34 TaxID=2926016 RepID=UPI0021C7EB10|nr:DCC1-like thiol-disulfide oxidoreductase family protein [Microvirga sp. Mcv34]
MRSRCREIYKDWRPQPAPGWHDRLILIDGVCVLCSSWAQFVIRRDETFRFLRIQSPQGRHLAESFGIDPDEPQTNVAIVGGTAYFKSDAALMVARHLRGWAWTRILRIVPRSLRNPLYDRVARNRYTWFGRDEVCLRPTQEMRMRCLDEVALTGVS